MESDSCPLSPLRIIDLTYVKVRNSNRRENGIEYPSTAVERDASRRDAHGMRTTLTWTTHDAARSVLK